VAFRRTLAIGSSIVRAAAVPALGTVPLGRSSAMPQLVALVGVLAGYSGWRGWAAESLLSAIPRANGYYKCVFPA
jgi:hypothetical protein